MRLRLTPGLNWLALFLVCVLPQVLLARPGVRRDVKHLSLEDLATLAHVADASKNLDPASPSSHLAKILIPRAPNTANNTFVRNHIVSTLRALKWDVEEDSFTGATPYGETRFTNVIATKDPEAAYKLVLAAHFDSKFFSTAPANQFVGATDSAVPCAILLDLAEALDPLLNRRAARVEVDDEEDNEAASTTLQLIFFDGEEAFKDWTATDSIYGARHLAERWETEFVASHPSQGRYTPAPVLETIEHFVLLDLLGAPAPLVHSYYLSTAWLFDLLVSAEQRLGNLGLLALSANDSNVAGENDKVKHKQLPSFFIPREKSAGGYFGGVEDDHIPFLRRGVSILHVITAPFPKVWHTLADDAAALDMPTMRKWNLIFRVFVAEYLGLRPDPPPAPPKPQPTKADSKIPRQHTRPTERKIELVSLCAAAGIRNGRLKE